MRNQRLDTSVFQEAIRSFWQTRTNQASKQAARGGIDQGARSAVTGGAQMNGFANLIADLAERCGAKPNQIFVGPRQVDLPGFYRATKAWDFLIVVEKKLIAAIELKSQVGPSFGNNFNNRTEEAIGTAVDLWTAYREGSLQTSPAPWLGYLFLLEDCPESRTHVRVNESHFPVRSEFSRASYSERYELFCRKLMLERQYSCTCFLMADRNRADEVPNYIEPASDLSASSFLSQLQAHLMAALAS